MNPQTKAVVSKSEMARMVGLSRRSFSPTCGNNLSLAANTT